MTAFSRNSAVAQVQGDSDRQKSHETHAQHASNYKAAADRPAGFDLLDN